MDLKITNNTDGKAYIIVWGFADGISKDNAPWSYLEKDGKDASKLTALPTSPAQVKDASKSNVDLLVELDSGDSIEYKNIPNIISGNVLISFKERPKLFAVVPAWKTPYTVTIPEHKGWGVQTPGFTPGTQDQYTIFCSSEFTLDSSGVWADTTNVDYFTAPITLEVNGSAGPQSSGKLNANVSRDDVFSAFTGITDFHVTDFKKLVMSDGETNIRVLAPGHDIPGALPTDYFDAYVAHCLGLYNSANPITVTVGGTYAGVYTGTPNTAARTISFVDSHSNPVGDVHIPTDAASSIFLCNNFLAAPNNTIGAITAVICAALNRTVLHLSGAQPYCTESDFYSTTSESESWWATNWYSNLLHKKISKVYGFAFDDVCNNANYKPLLHDPKPTSVAISLDSWAGTSD